MAEMNHPVQFWYTLGGLVIVFLVMLKLIQDFWFNLKGQKVSLYLKIFTLSYPIILMIRFIFEMITYIKYNETISIIGNYIAYIDGFCLYTYLALRLLLIFRDSIYAMTKWRLTLYFIILSINMIYGMTVSSIHTLTHFMDTVESKSVNKAIISTIYPTVQLLLTIWILIAFNARLYLLVLTAPETNTGLLAPLTASISMSSASNADDNTNISKQQQYMQLITKQTLLVSIILSLRSVNIIMETFASLRPDLYDHNKWKIPRVTWRTLTVILIYLSFKFELSNKLYGALCNPLHKSCYFCCQCILNKKLEETKHKNTINNSRDQFYL